MPVAHSAALTSAHDWHGAKPVEGQQLIRGAVGYRVPQQGGCSAGVAGWSLGKQLLSTLSQAAG